MFRQSIRMIQIATVFWAVLLQLASHAAATSRRHVLDAEHDNCRSQHDGFAEFQNEKQGPSPWSAKCQRTEESGISSEYLARAAAPSEPEGPKREDDRSDKDQEDTANAEAELAEPTENVRTRVRVKVLVTDQDTEEPLGDADVAVRSIEDGERYREEARSNRRGIAEFTEVPAGRALITVTKQEFGTWNKTRELSQNPSTIEAALKKKD